MAARAAGAGIAWRRWVAIGAMTVTITLLHYSTSFHLHGAHGIYRRLYYFPIILAAFTGGWPAGLGTALAVCALYIPHAYGVIGRDPAPTLEKSLEMALYIAVGLVAGMLVSRERRAVAQKKSAEAQLARQARLAAVGRLSAGLAHEIRNPLASIQGAAEVLADDFPPGHHKGRLLRVLMDESGRLNTVLTRFLAFARPQQGRRELVELAAEARDIVQLVRHRPGAPRLAGPPPAAAAAVRGDREQLRQLLLNLVLNAAEAAGAAGMVRVEIARAGAAVSCTVEDDGPGFGAEALANLGQPFYTTKEGGTGLGLAIALRIAEDHGGRLAAADRPGGGARVTVELPGAKEG